MDWHDAIHAFWTANSSRTWLSVQPTGNCFFEARIDFTADARNAIESTKVTLIRNGHEDGAVLVDEAGELTNEDFHTKFLPIKPSTCRYMKQTNSLHISGRSPKMGNYKVSITPTESEA